MPLLFFFSCADCGVHVVAVCLSFICVVNYDCCRQSVYSIHISLFFLIQWTCGNAKTKHYAWQFGSSGFSWGDSTKYRVFFHGKFVISTLHALDNFTKPIEMRTIFVSFYFFSAWNLTHHRCHAIHLIFKWPFNLTWTENNMMGCTPSTGVVWAYKKC